MPELPEVETVVRGLERTLEGRKLTRAEKMRPDLRYPIPDLTPLEGAQVLHCHRRSKYALIDFSNGQTLLLHLGMSGRVVFASPNEPPVKHDHVVLTFGNTQLRFNDPRRFGFVDIFPTQHQHSHKHLAHLGPEPLTDKFTFEGFYTALKKRQSPIKTTIMDNKLVVGVGNIYACEALFMAGIRPTTKAHRLAKGRIQKLHGAIVEVLEKAIAAGGTSLRDYVQTDGSLGYFQHQFKVYGRAGKPCQTCQTPIKIITQTGRSTFYCPQCQT